MTRHLVSAVLAAVLVAGAAAVQATVLVPADLTELAREALTIVHGRVVDVRGVWTEGRRRVETVVTLQVRATLKGQGGSEVSVRVPGGEMGRYRSIVVGAPRFHQGEEVVLFLGGRAPALPYLLGLGQGVYRVVREPGTGRALVTPAALVAGGGGPVVRGDTARQPLGIAEFTEQVKQALAADRERKIADRERRAGRER